MKVDELVAMAEILDVPIDALIHPIEDAEINTGGRTCGTPSISRPRVLAGDSTGRGWPASESSTGRSRSSVSGCAPYRVRAPRGVRATLPPDPVPSDPEDLALLDPEED